MLQPDDIFPFLIGALIFMIPIIAILTQHQRKMALIMRGRDEEGRTIKTPEVDQVREEMNELRQLIHKQSIALDNMASQQAEILASLKGQGELQQRVGQ
ncbi:MAG: hypothetical protein WAO58_09575 [Fimbriimonadaceae bacterium]